MNPAYNITGGYAGMLWSVVFRGGMLVRVTIGYRHEGQESPTR